MKAELERLADRVEASLRRSFAEHARRGNHLALLKVGEQIRALLPDRPVAADFERIKPALQKALARKRPDPAPALRIVR